MGNATVSAGDYVIADGSGVVFLAADQAEEIISIAEKVAEKERFMTQDVLNGKPVSEVMGTNYEDMLKSK